MTAVIIIRLINDFFRGVACFGYWYTKVALFCMSTGIMITVFKMKTGRSCLAHHYFFLTIYSACLSGLCSVVDLEKIFRDCNSFQCSPPNTLALGVHAFGDYKFNIHQILQTICGQVQPSVVFSDKKLKLLLQTQCMTMD